LPSNAPIRHHSNSKHGFLVTEFCQSRHLDKRPLWGVLDGRTVRWTVSRLVVSVHLFYVLSVFVSVGTDTDVHRNVWRTVQSVDVRYQYSYSPILWSIFLSQWLSPTHLKIHAQPDQRHSITTILVQCPTTSPCIRRGFQTTASSISLNSFLSYTFLDDLVHLSVDPPTFYTLPYTYPPSSLNCRFSGQYESERIYTGTTSCKKVDTLFQLSL